jgi:nicotinate-nucleotide pyrophosphorylase (carboxylating)
MIASTIIDTIVRAALREDLLGGDLTTDATVAPDTRAIARAVAHSELVVCGAEVFARVFYELDPGLRVERLLPEGTLALPGQTLFLVEGSARSILYGERTALNFIQRMSGIATQARAYQDAIPEGTRARVVDTRKTTPGLRALERYAVRVGGCHNHRDSLGSAVLIKDNHIEASGGITPAIERARKYAPHTCRIEIEVESLDGVDEALAAGADIIMLDNFDPASIAQAVARCQKRALVEVSGGISLERIASLAHAGVDIISVGALTHSVMAADIGLDIERLGSAAFPT